MIIALTEKIIRLHIGHQSIQLVHKGSAGGVELISIEVVIRVIASFHLMIGGIINNTVPVSLFNECSSSIVFPVGDTVTDSETFKRYLIFSWVCSVIGIDSLSKLRNVNASIRFTS